MAEEKSFQPSKRKLDRARKEGNVAKSQVITHGVALLLLPICINQWWSFEPFLEVWREHFNQPERASAVLLPFLLKSTAMTLGFYALTVVLLTMLQVGFRFEFGVLAVKSERLNPASGVGRMVSGLKTVPGLLIRTVCFAGVSYFVLRMTITSLVTTSSLTGGALISRDMLLVLKGLGFFAGTVLIIGAVDYFFVRRRYYRELSMSHDEVRREHKDEEGDPYLKARRKAIHESLARQEIVQRIRRSKVIIVE